MSSSGGTSEGKRPEAGSPVAGPGVLGNLPRSRPAVRSPRRTAANPPPGAAAGNAGAKPGPSPADAEGRMRGGLAVAGGAASLGLRIAGRAAAAVRGAVERR